MHSDHQRARRFTLAAIARALPVATIMFVLPIFAVALPVAALGAGSQAVVQQSADVRSAPSASSSQVTEAPANQPVQILDRRGAWYEVSSTSGWRGWVRLAAIKLTSLTQTKTKTSLPGTEPTAVIGVRGLDEASLARAQPDYAALERLRGYRVAPDDAERFAAELRRGGSQ